jgi:hypothetical protein
LSAPDGERPDRPAGPWLAPFRAVLRGGLSVALFLWTLLDVLLFPLFRPLLHALGRLRLFELIGAGLGRLPPYAALAVLGVPFVVIEPLKAFALYWAVGHWVQGLVLLVFAHVLSILVVERIYHAAHGPLMRIGWFRRLMAWLDGLRRLGLGWARSTAVWRIAARLAASVRASVTAWLRSIG